jgi:hypothetical protein
MWLNWNAFSQGSLSLNRATLGFVLKPRWGSQAARKGAGTGERASWQHAARVRGYFSRMERMVRMMPFTVFLLRERLDSQAQPNQTEPERSRDNHDCQRNARANRRTDRFGRKRFVTRGGFGQSMPPHPGHDDEEAAIRFHLQPA